MQRSETCYDTIMSTATLTGLAMMLAGGIAAHAGLRAGAIAFLNAWLCWPAGALACGVAFLRHRAQA